MFAVLLGVIMTFVIITFHYFALLCTNRIANSISSHFIKSISVVSSIFIIHLVEILWFSTNLYLLHSVFGYSGFADNFFPTAIDYIHLSASAFTTLGITSVAPTESLALFIDLIALTGFTMLTWSATYYYNIFSTSDKPSE